jgi:23S rRNA pseudouridine955/2504/2580 synthase
LNSPEKQPRAGAYRREVEAESAGQRLDNFLLSSLKGVPRSHVYRLIRSGQVRVNSGRARPAYRLRAGDQVRVPPVSQAASTAIPDRGGLEWLARRIVFEDARLMVLDKPAGLAVHGGSGLRFGCIEALRSLRPELAALELVHRLDRATSGCLLIAKRRSALRRLHELLRQGRMDKRYFGLVAGHLADGVREVDAPLRVRRVEGEARVSVDSAGKSALSSFRLLDRYAAPPLAASFVDISIATGRTHQIRVHAAHFGHPLAGDERYGDVEFNERLEHFGLHRMFLHAHSVAFDWPDTGQPFAVSVPLPPELRAVLDNLTPRAATSGP